MIPPLSVAICIATYRRPSMLRNLFASLQRLTFTRKSEPEITVVVIDNDPLASARPVVAEFLSRRFRIRYQVELRRGVSYTRNAAIQNSRNVDFLAFLDDDEEPTPPWLDELLAVQAAFDAPIVAGPVLPHFSIDPPQWIIDGRFFERKRYPTGMAMATASGGNVLIGSQVVHALAPSWFDPRFTLTGGEDTHFFRRCTEHGFPITWANDAVVFESIPEERMSQQWLVCRARNGGNHWTRVDLELRPSLRNLSHRFAVGLIRICQGSALAVVPTLSPRRHLRGRLLLAEGIGNLQAFFGRTYDAYGAQQ